MRPSSTTSAPLWTTSGSPSPSSSATRRADGCRRPVTSTTRTPQRAGPRDRLARARRERAVAAQQRAVDVERDEPDARGGHGGYSPVHTVTRSITSPGRIRSTTSMPADHLAEERVAPVEVRLRRKRDEELAAAGVLPRQRHAHGAAAVGAARDLAAQRVAGAAVAVAARAAALHDEAGLDAVEAQAVVEAAPRERHEGGRGERRLDDVEVDLDRAVARLQEGARRVERHAGRAGRRGPSPRDSRAARARPAAGPGRSPRRPASRSSVAARARTARDGSRRATSARPARAASSFCAASAATAARRASSSPSPSPRPRRQAARSGSDSPAGERPETASAAATRTPRSGCSRCRLCVSSESLPRAVASAPSTAADDARVLVAQHRVQDPDAHLVAAAAERAGERRAHPEVAVGVHARQHEREVLAVVRRERPERRGADPGIARAPPRRTRRSPSARSGGKPASVRSASRRTTSLGASSSGRGRRRGRARRRCAPSARSACMRDGLVAGPAPAAAARSTAEASRERAQAARGERALLGLVRRGRGHQHRPQLGALEPHRHPGGRPPVEARARAVEERQARRRRRP